MFQIASDLHLEFYQSKFSDNDIDTDALFNRIVKPSAPNLILAGDIGYPEERIYSQFLQWVSSKFKRVFIVSGNHEYYTKKPMSEIDRLIGDICSKYSNVNFLNRYTEPVQFENWTVLGCTLWSDVNADSYIAIESSMNDYIKIYTDKDKPLSAYYMVHKLHLPDLEYLNRQLNMLKDSNRNIMVVTHHLPSYKLIPEKYQGDSLNEAFATHLDEYLTGKWTGTIDKCYWIAGHSHGHNYATVGKWQLYLNAMGYPGEYTKYKTNYCISDI